MLVLMVLVAGSGTQAAEAQPAAAGGPLLADAAANQHQEFYTQVINPRELVVRLMADG